MRRLIALFLAFLFVAGGATALVLVSVSSSLPRIFSKEDYKPFLVSEVYARGGERIGEFYREYRILIPYEKIPKLIIQAFVAAEDDQFFQHRGINYAATLRALVTNIAAGRKKQGASTITQQLSRQLFLSSEKTWTRKLREALLAYKLEEKLSKEDILYLYLNQIYFGEGAHGIGAAAEIFFRKKVEELRLSEIAMLAGLQQRPSDYSPVHNPGKAKERQRYVIARMIETHVITAEQGEAALKEPVSVAIGRRYRDVAPYFVETVRQMLVQKLGETKVLDEGLKIYTSIDYSLQVKAQEALRKGLRSVDERQGWRGPIKHIDGETERVAFLKDSRRKLEFEALPLRVIPGDQARRPPEEPPLQIFHQRDSNGHVIGNLPLAIHPDQVVEALVVAVDDDLGLAEVRFGEVQALIDLEDMTWARKPDPTIDEAFAPHLTRPSQALKEGDVVHVRVTHSIFQSTRLQNAMVLRKKKKLPVHFTRDLKLYARAALTQEPQLEGSLISFDQSGSGELVALVGGYDFQRSEFNRALQAKRQTGSSFKPIVYSAALDKGFTASTMVQDAPLSYENESGEGASDEGQNADITKWKPRNHGGKFSGDLMFRTALAHSLNVPTVRILEKVGVQWTIEYARRLGIFSPLNADLSLGLGSSSVTLYEMTKALAILGRGGRRTSPIMVHKVTDRNGNDLLTDLSIDAYFEKDILPIEKEFAKKRETALKERQEAVVEPPPLTDPTAGISAERETASVTPTPLVPKAEVFRRKWPTSPNLYFDDPDQLVSPELAAVATNLLTAPVVDAGGTAARARVLERPIAGKTGSTSGYFDAWFVGYSMQYATGVWVGYDHERTLGKGEVGGRAALPIWIDYMKLAHENLPPIPFPVPDGVVFADIDTQTGLLAGPATKSVVKAQPFIRGTEPTDDASSARGKDDAELLRDDLSD